MSAFPEKLLLATDGSEDATLAARAANDLSGRTGAELHVVHVWQDLRPPNLPAAAVGEYLRAYEEWEQEARELLEEQAEHLRSTGGTVADVYLRNGQPAEEIAALAEELDAELVVVGSRGLGTVKRLVVGSVSEGVVSLAPCPVLVVRGGKEAWPPPRIVVGADLSEEAGRAANLAVNFGYALALEVLVVIACPRPMPVSCRATPGALAQADRGDNRAWEALLRLSAGLENVIEARPKTRTVLGDAATVIQDAAEEGEKSALVVVGRRGIGAIRRSILGGVSSDVMRSVDGPVLIVPSPDQA